MDLSARLEADTHIHAATGSIPGNVIDIGRIGMFGASGRPGAGRGAILGLRG